MKFKILFDLHPYTARSTGIGRYSFNLLNHLTTYSNLNLYAYTNPASPPLPAPTFTFPFRNGLARITLGFPLALTRLRPHLLHFHYFPPLLNPTSSLLVNTIHDLCFLSHPRHFTPKQHLMFRLFALPFLHRSQAIIVPTHFVKKQLLHFTSLSPHKIFVIPEGVDPIFSPLNKTQAQHTILNQYHISSPFFLVVGNIESRKNPHRIISAFLPLLTHPRKPNLVFVGPLKQPHLLKSAHPYLHQRIFHFPYLSNSQLNLFYNGATALIYYSQCEGFGLPPLEAARTRTPSILNNIPPLQETMSSHAFFVTAPTQLTTALHHLLTTPPSPTFLDSLYHHSLNFTWQKTASLTHRLYLRLLTSSSQPSL